MPKRMTVKKYATEEVQGAGSYVKLSAIKVKEIKALRKRANDQDSEFDVFGMGMSLVAEHVLDWNWVDDDGEPLPAPQESPEVLDELTSDEANLIARLLMGEDEAKN